MASGWLLLTIPATAIALAWCIGWLARGVSESVRNRPRF